MTADARTATQTKPVQTPHGHAAEMLVRDGTSDLATVGATFRLWDSLVDEYRIPSGLQGWALDVGAHIGAVTVALLLDNPALRVVAVEALPANTAMLRENLRLNQVEDRCTVVEAAAWDSTDPVDVSWGYDGSEIAETNRYIGSVTPWLDAPGGSTTTAVRGFTLQDALDLTDGQGFVWTKIDCEGCEFRFLKGRQLAKLGEIVGEYHQRDGKPEALVRRFAKTHDVTWAEGIGGGPFRAVPR